jgi:hypothetical protein
MDHGLKTMTMKSFDIPRLRLACQQISGTRLKTAADIVGRLGAIQAQDLPMALWAIGVRLPRSTVGTIEAAVSRGAIIRTHLLRPTWHFAAAADIRWMLALSAPQILGAMKARHIQLGLAPAVLTKGFAVLEKALRGGSHLTREEMIAALGRARIATADGRASHLFLCAEAAGLICSGAMKNGKPTFALLDEWVPRTEALPKKEEALARLAIRYFTGHGPATLEDFIWWSGLPVGQARQALESVKRDLRSTTVASATYWYSGGLSVPSSAPDSVYLLPAFDEFLIGYKDRRASLPHESRHKAVSNNGIFWPIVVVNGRIIGTWKKAAAAATPTYNFFERPDSDMRALIGEATARYNRFIAR